jgi:CheY-like chemotaxis protein
MKTTSNTPSKILLVDDNRDGLIVRKLLLEELGYQVQTANTGDDALKAYSAARFDVVVTDQRMPRMSGVELIGRIRVLNPHARIVLLSGFVDALGLNEESTGADVVLAKDSKEPVYLVRWIKRLANRQSLRKPPAAQKKTAAAARALAR